MEALPDSRQVHEQLESLKDQCSCWSLDADRQLQALLPGVTSSHKNLQMV